MSEWSEPLRTVGLHRRRPDQLLSEAAELIIHGGELRLRQDAGLLENQCIVRANIFSFTIFYFCWHQ